MKRIEAFGSKVYLVNTGWTGGSGGPGGEGQRFSIPTTRAVISAIQNGELLNVATQHIDALNLDVPLAVPGLRLNYLIRLIPWRNSEQYHTQANKLAAQFIENFKQYDVPDAIVNAGPPRR